MSMPRILAALAVLTLLAGCARPAAYVVLLDQPDHPGSAVTWTNQAGTQVVATPGSGTGADRADAKPADVFAVPEKDIQDRFGQAIKAQPRTPKSFLLYFQFQSTDLTPESKALLPSVLDEVKARPAPDLSIIGHTDGMGDAKYNYELGLRRAKEVQSMVTALGIEPRMIEVTSHGQSNPLVPEAKGKGEAQNRRVEVTVR